MKIFILLFILIQIFTGCTNNIIPSQEYRKDGVYKKEEKTGDMLVSFMMMSGELDKSISDTEEKELIAKKLRIPRELIIGSGEKISYFYDEESLQNKDKIFIVYNLESYEKMTKDFYKKFIKEGGYSDIKKYSDEAVTLGEIIWNMQNKKIYIIANENENYYIMDALHYINLKYCRENFFQEKIRDMKLDIISVNSPLFLEKHMKGFSNSKVRYYTNENGNLYAGKEVTVSENIGYGMRAVMYGISKGLEIISLPKNGIKKLLGSE